MTGCLVVFKAKRLNTNELAAIKVIKLEAGKFEEKLWQYVWVRVGFVGDDFGIIQQEILMMKDCRHPNIIAYYGSYLRRDKLWICMEYCGGGSLQDIYHSECFFFVAFEFFATLLRNVQELI